MARFWCTVALVALMVLCKGAEAARLRASAKSLHGSSSSADPLMNRPGQMMGLPAPEGSNFFHPDGLPTWMRPSALPQKFRSPAVPAGGGAMVPASMPVAPSMVRTIASHSAALDR